MLLAAHGQLLLWDLLTPSPDRTTERHSIIFVHAWWVPRGGNQLIPHPATPQDVLRLSGYVRTLDKKMALLRLNAMRKFIANVKHHIYARIYTDVNIFTVYANIYNTFTAYVKVQTYLHTYLRLVCRASKCGIYLRTYLPYVCSY